MSYSHERKIELLKEQVKELQDERRIDRQRIDDLYLIVKTKIHDIIVDVVRENIEIDLHDVDSEDKRLLRVLQNEVNNG